MTERDPAGSGGGFTHGRWWIHTPGDDPRSAQYASAHESHHKQLEATSSFGNLTWVVVEMSRAGAHVGASLVADLVGASRATHEAFASWVPAFVLGWTRDDIGTHYPEYLRDYDAMDSLVAGVESAYLRLHCAHALARLCMQSDVLTDVLGAGFGALRLADLRNVQRPDWRFGTLRRNPPPLRRLEAEVTQWLTERAATPPQDEQAGTDPAAVAQHALELLARPSLSADMLGAHLRNEFTVINTAVYALMADHARTLGVDCLGHEEHLLAAGPLLAAAEEFAGVPMNLVSGLPDAGSTRSAGEATDDLLPAIDRPGDAADLSPIGAHARRAVASVDYEQFSVAPALDARWVEDSTALGQMAAGVEDVHLFVAVRTADQLRNNYRARSWPPGVGERQDTVVSVARRTVTSDGGDGAGAGRSHLVELLDVTDSMPPRAQAPAPVVTSVSMSLLTTPQARRLDEYLRPEISTVLVDVPLEPQLSLWLASPGSRVRWVLLRTEGHGRVVPVLILRVQNDHGTGHLMIKPVSHAAAGILRAGFEEVDPAGTYLVLDPTLLDDNPALLKLTLSHLIGEEVWFGVE